MHPAIRLFNCLILIGFLVSGQWLLQLLTVGILCVLVTVAGRGLLAALAQSLLRLRWLFAGIMLLYLWLPPIAVETGSQHISAGLYHGLYRVGLLAGVVALVQCLFWFTHRRQVLSGLLWWLQPLAALGLPADRVALRLCLVLETVPAARALLQHELPPPDPEPAVPSFRARLIRAAQTLADSYSRAVTQAERAPLDPIEIPLPVRPAPSQWLLSLLMLGLLIGVLLGA